MPRPTPRVRPVRRLAAAVLLGLLLVPLRLPAQAAPMLPLPEDPALSAALREIVAGARLDGTFETGDGPQRVGVAVVDLGGAEPVFGGVSADDFIYPASLYKMYVAAEVLRQVREGRYELATPRVVAPHNAVDTSVEVAADPRPLLQGGDTVTVGYLLDLMVTRSDNSAANELIDLAGRPAIDSLMHRYGWRGSEVTRKFLARADEEPGYADVRGTETSARHAAEFLYLAATDRLADPWVSRRLMILLGGQLDDTKLAAGLPRSAVFHHKTGWWGDWTNDAGVVLDGDARYVVAVLTPLPEEEALPRMRRLAAEVHRLMTERAASR